MPIGCCGVEGKRFSWLPYYFITESLWLAGGSELHYHLEQPVHDWCQAVKLLNISSKIIDSNVWTVLGPFLMNKKNFRISTFYCIPFSQADPSKQHLPLSESSYPPFMLLFGTNHSLQQWCTLWSLDLSFSPPPSSIKHQACGFRNLSQRHSFICPRPCCPGLLQ